MYKTIVSNISSISDDSNICVLAKYDSMWIKNLTKIKTANRWNNMSLINHFIFVRRCGVVPIHGLTGKNQNMYRISRYFLCFYIKKNKKGKKHKCAHY